MNKNFNIFCLLAFIIGALMIGGCVSQTPIRYGEHPKRNATPLAEASESKTEISAKWQQYRIVRGAPAASAVDNFQVFITPSDRWEPYGIPFGKKSSFLDEVPSFVEIPIDDFEFFKDAAWRYNLSPDICLAILKEARTYGHADEILKVCAETDLHPVSARALLERFKTFEGVCKNVNLPPKYEEISAEVSIGYFMESTMRTWQIVDGTSHEGRWLTVNKDGDLIRIYPNEKIVEGDRGWVFALASLQKDCQDTIAKKISEYKAAGRDLWFNGFYISEKNKSGIIEASKLIKEKSYYSSYTHYELLKVFSTWGGLARFSNRDVFFLDEKIQGVAADGEEFWKQELYWASTYTYHNTLGDVVTVPCYSPNQGRAINRVRAALNLYDDTDPRMGGRKEELPETHKQPSTSSSNLKLASSGSGFFVTKDGFLLTNHHVIKGAKKVEVVAGSAEERRTYEAMVVDSDENLDLALMKVSVTNTPCLALSATEAKQGLPVYVVGFPMPDLQGFEVKMTDGIISGMKGLHDNTFHYQISAAIQPGNSGGPLCDKSGAVVGVCDKSVNEFYAIKKHGTIPQNVNYAIKSTFVRAFLDSTPGCKYTLKEEETDSKTEYDEAASAQMSAATVLIQVYE